MAVGHSAASNANGEHNIAGNFTKSIGFYWFSNVAIGRQAIGLQNAAGDNVVWVTDPSTEIRAVIIILVWDESLQDNTTGVQNVALGYLALENNTSGQKNIGIGRSALDNNTTGDKNITIGDFSDVGSNNQQCHRYWC